MLLAANNDKVCTEIRAAVGAEPSQPDALKAVVLALIETDTSAPTAAQQIASQPWGERKSPISASCRAGRGWPSSPTTCKCAGSLIKKYKKHAGAGLCEWEHTKGRALD